MPTQIEQKYQTLTAIIRQQQRVIVAYSGGVDSVYLLKATAETLGPQNVLACIGDSESLARSEMAQAITLAQDMGVALQVVYPHEMQDPNYRANPANRCFHCKSHLYKLLRQVADEKGFDAVYCGTNADDLNDFRPGLQAAKKYSIASPLEQAGLTKADIRQLSQQAGLATWDKPAQPCLASRMAYGSEITPEKLKQIEQGESYLRSLGLKELRVRHHGDLVRIEVPVDQITQLTQDDKRREITGHFKGMGFTYVTVDLQGFRSGSGNEILVNPAKRP